MSTSLANTILTVGLGLGLTLSGITFVAAVASGGETGFAKHGTVIARRTKQKEPQISITVAGKDDWYVNTEYNAKIVIGDTELRKADGLYKDINAKGDKAASVTWITNSMAKTGTAKLVFCNSTSCTAPISTSFTVR